MKKLAVNPADPTTYNRGSAGAHVLGQLGKVLRYSTDRQAVASIPYHRSRWVHATDSEERQMLTQQHKALSAEGKTQVKELIDELYEAEVEAERLREFGQSRRLLSMIWDNPSDAEYNDL